MSNDQEWVDRILQAQYLIEKGYPVQTFDALDLAEKLKETPKIPENHPVVAVVKDKED